MLGDLTGIARGLKVVTSTEPSAKTALGHHATQGEQEKQNDQCCFVHGFNSRTRFYSPPAPDRRSIPTIALGPQDSEVLPPVPAIPGGGPGNRRLCVARGQVGSEPQRGRRDRVRASRDKHQW